MKIAVLSRNSKLISTKRLMEAGIARGHDMHVIDYTRCFMNIASGKPQVMLGDVSLDGIDAVIPRIGASKTFYGTAVVRQFEVMGVYPLNESQAITRSRDKLRCHQLLSRKGVGMPVTGFANSPKDIDALIRSVGGAPLVVKLLEGTQGIGVVLCETLQAARSVIEAFRGLDANILVQEFIKESRGRDVRAFVVGEKVVAAMERQGAEGDFRSNLHRGGHATSTKLTKDERTTALAAAKAMGLRVAGVDMLRSERGPLVMEVNSTPGLEGIESSTGRDVAGTIIEYIETNASERRTRDRVRG